MDGQLIAEEYLYTTCAGGDAPCQPYRQIPGGQINLKTNCGGGGDATNDPILEYIRHKICRTTFLGFQSITNDNSSYSLNILDFKFVSGTKENAFDASINVQNKITADAMNVAQPTAMPEFMPPGLAYKSPVQLYDQLPVLRQLVNDGDVHYTYNNAENRGVFTFSTYAHSVICALAADWAAANTYVFSPNPAYNATAASTFRRQFQGILSALLPGSRVTAETNVNINTKFAIYDPLGLCN